MTSAFDRLREQVGRLEADRENVPNKYIPVSRRMDGALSRQTAQDAVETVTVRFPGLTARPVVQTYTTIVWSSSYPTGGEAPTVPFDTIVPDIQNVLALPVNGYTFAYNAGTGKIQAYTTAGTEVVATTDLSAAVGTTPLIVVGRGDTVLPGWLCPDGAILTDVTVRFTSAVARHGTNYWTLGVAIRSPGQNVGRRVGSQIVTNARGIAANGVNLLYSGPGYETVASGDEVVLWATASTASTLPLGDAVMTLTIRKKVP